MRFDLVDLQLFIAVAETRSITGGAVRVHLALASASARIKGLEAALGVALLKRGRRGVELTAAGESLLDHARIIMHNVETMRGDLAAFARGVKASVRLLANTSGLSEYLPKALAAFLREHPDIQHRCRGAREHRYRRRHRHRRRRSRASRPSMRLPESIERISVQRGSPGAGHVAARRFGGPAAGRFREVVGRDFVGLTTTTALHAHIAGHAARLGMRLRFRARLEISMRSARWWRPMSASR